MSAPDRIWATEDAANYGQDRFHTTRPMKGLTEYVRADLVQDLIRQAVEAEREACAVVTETMHETSWPYRIAAAIRAREGKA